jgi:NADPH2:quinone reductase
MLFAIVGTESRRHLLVLGAGGVGLAAVEIGKAVGDGHRLRPSDDKLAVCREHGADATINYVAEDRARPSSV